MLPERNEYWGFYRDYVGTSTAAAATAATAATTTTPATTAAAVAAAGIHSSILANRQ